MISREELTGDNSLDIVDSSDTVRNLKSNTYHTITCLSLRNRSRISEFIHVDQVLVEEIDYGDEDSVKQATDLLLQKELASEV